MSGMHRLLHWIWVLYGEVNETNIETCIATRNTPANTSGQADMLRVGDDVYRAIRRAYIKGEGGEPNDPLFTRELGGTKAIVASDVEDLCRLIKARAWDPESKISPHSLKSGVCTVVDDC